MGCAFWRCDECKESGSGIVDTCPECGANVYEIELDPDELYEGDYGEESEAEGHTIH
jgi:hypothetical protein